MSPCSSFLATVSLSGVLCTGQQTISTRSLRIVPATRWGFLEAAPSALPTHRWHGCHRRRCALIGGMGAIGWIGGLARLDLGRRLRLPRVFLQAACRERLA